MTYRTQGLKVTLQVLQTLVLTLLMYSCYSNNCPMNNEVTCNYTFYDMNGTPVKFGDELTVSAFIPGVKSVWVYSKFGSPSITLNERNLQLLSEGYTESNVQVHNDTILINKLVDATTIKIPMSYFNPADTLVFKYGSIRNCDTLVVQHDSYPYVSIPECGCYRFHTLKKISATEAYIDHIEITEDRVTYDGNENVKIYLIGEAE